MKSIKPSSLNLFSRNNKKYIYDPIRQKLVFETPEEVVRQKTIQYLINEKEVPENMIEVEVPMSYFLPNAKGRADIIVYSIKGDTMIPVLIIECKSMKTPLIDNVYDQVYKYETLLQANTIAVTNGNDFFVETWDEQEDQYFPLNELPKFKDLVVANNFEFVKPNVVLYKKRKFEDFNSEEISNFKGGFLEGIKDKSLQKFIINLNELFWDDTVLIHYDELYGVKYIQDNGLRYTKFNNASGIGWTGDYRSFIVEDKKGSHQIISLAIIEGYIIVAIDNDKVSHNSLQLSLPTYAKSDEQSVEILHTGRLTVGKSGMAKFSEVLDFVEEKEPRLLNAERKIQLGNLDNTEQLEWENKDVKDFIGRLVKYALIRDEFREQKKKQLKKRRKKK
ncbi:type I restriction enzyme HsdR N-terminal domain-containing protein [Planomicrobium chinense]|uniref:type I restriction enzyme HsdR N-terminal domain-containing protein n=1 Tax=Planococcus chinensis TaxID=272917 RepID=UPI001CC55CE1|nr:type I restriction enzyme HsdR N-terminal domain-containing protein [Planococcus chinensis]MBZ5201989.1 type I restriction enzyme HsdR N-terminal domain-containing protein [Planococcus chinensis]